MAESAKMILENVASIGGRLGVENCKYMTASFSSIVYNKEPDRTADEIVEHIRSKLEEND